MAVAYVVTPELRVKLKEPFGTLLVGAFSETMSKLRVLVDSKKPPKIVGVGDTVSRNLHECGFTPQLSITDNKSMRKRIKTATFHVGRVMRVANPKGTITEEAIAAVREALGAAEEVHLLVDGEEDLLTLIAILYAPERSFVVYGQPYEGVVVVEATPEKRAEAAEILNAMAVRKS
jgi:uncharacterized protein (UPF0218 family)